MTTTPKKRRNPLRPKRRLFVQCLVHKVDMKEMDYKGTRFWICRKQGCTNRVKLEVR